MQIENTTEWCLLWVGPCLQSSEWAAWAQAIFSALAVLAAIGVVWWQLQIAKKERTAAARFVACGLLTFNSQITGGLQAVAEALQQRVSGQNTPANSPTNLVTILSTLPFPSKEDLIALNASLPACSISLFRASNLARQLRETLGLLAKATSSDDNAVPAEMYEQMHKLARSAERGFSEAHEILDEFCPP